MPKFTVYHKDWAGIDELYRVLLRDRDLTVLHVLSKAEYEKVAVVECPALHDVFRLTNTIERPWWENPEVVDLRPGRDGFRSTSVGDVVEDESGTLHLCAPVGWARAQWKED